MYYYIESRPCRHVFNTYSREQQLSILTCFIVRYVGEGMEESEFTVAEESIKELISVS